MWAVMLAVGVEVLVTYTRIPVRELYHVRSGGIAAGAGRTLAFVGFPVGLAAAAILAIVADRAGRRATAFAAAAGAALAVAIVWPGALDESGLDTPPARALAALGVALTLGLTIVAAARGGLGPLGREPGDRVRLAGAAALVVVALPWLAADLGLALDRVPVLGWIFQTDVLARQPGRPGLHPAVHDGHHHGMDGVLLALSALLLSRAVPHLRHRRLRACLGVYLAFLLVYGTANAVQDAWLEQVVKRGWSTTELPMMLVPSARPAWIVIVVLTSAVVAAGSRLPASAPSAARLSSADCVPPRGRRSSSHL
ncbi:hypothetical protein [Gaiella occulta]|nr:hypothetical protein [Gaiella occulta]